MYGSAVFHIAAKAYGEVGKPPLFVRQGHKVGQGLSGMKMSAVTCVYDGTFRIERRRISGAFYGITHNQNVGIIADHPYGILQALAL